MPNRFLYGVTAYPEHWDRASRLRDVDRIARAGFNIVRLGEGAWWYWEPREGEYQFELFDEVIDRFARRDVSVILGTPTYASPAWVSCNYPEVLRWNIERVPMAHGSRRNLNYTSPKYLDLSDRICTALADRYANAKNVIGWQLDNEFNCHMDVSYAPSDTIAFRAWLKAKYKTLDGLNEAWGTRFWSQIYDDWEQIDLPHPTPTYHNPTHLLDESRFISDCVVHFAQRQAAILRKRNAKWRITHNGIFGNVDPPKLAGVLDYFSHDHYPLFWPDWPGPAAKLQEARSLSFPFAIMEQQAGPGGQMAYLHRTPLPGELRLWAMQSIAHGADTLLYFTWRTCPFGSEQHWHGLLDADGIDSRRLSEAKLLGKELAKLPDDFLDAAPVRQAAVLRDFDNGVNEARIDTYTAAGRKEDGRWLEALGKAHVPADVVWPKSDWDGYRVLVAPHLKLINEALVKRLTRFVRAGGTLVLGAQSGLKDRNNHVRTQTPPGLLRELTGIEVAEWTTLAETAPKRCRLSDGREIEMIAFAESLRLLERKTEVLATWQADALSGDAPAIVRRPLGRGQVIYVGGYLLMPSIATMIALLEKTGVVEPLVRASDRVEAIQRRGKQASYLVLLNHGTSAQTVEDLPRSAKALLGPKLRNRSATLEPFGVVVCRC